MRDYAAIARQYTADVLSGAQPAGEFVRLACERQQRDLAQQSDAAWPYRFEETAANKVCKFIELFPHIEGPLVGQRIELAPWQVFLLTTLFGWLKKDTGKRRYRRAYTEVPRGNGKSAISSPLCVYMLVADGEGGPQVYSAARTKEQAMIVFETAQKMLRSEEGAKVRKHYGIQVLARSIVHPKSNGKFMPLASEADSLDGKNTHFACLDELHAHPNADVHDTMDTSLGKRDQSMMWMITTAGTDLTGICYMTRDYVTKVLQGVFTDESYFGIVYTIDKEDEWDDPTVWAKANPNYGVSVFPDDLANKATKARAQVSMQVNFKTKHLDVWQSSGSAWMDMRRFGAGADPLLKEEDFIGKPCLPGLDLASKVDLLSFVKMFYEHRDDGKRHYTAFWEHWMPEGRVLSSPVAVQQWVGEKRIRTCPGDTNDFNQVEDEIRRCWSAYDVKEVAHDPHGALEMVNKLAGEGIIMFGVDQNVKNLSPAMKELEAAVADGRFHYNGDPVAYWAMSNVISKKDVKDNDFPRKARLEDKIDPVSAALAAIIRIMVTDSAPAPETGKASVFGRCAKCGEMCIGEIKDGVVLFICKKHASAS